MAVPQVPYTMFSVYDGHAGAGCAVTASNDLWQAVQVAWQLCRLINSWTYLDLYIDLETSAADTVWHKLHPSFPCPL